MEGCFNVFAINNLIFNEVKTILNHVLSVDKLEVNFLLQLLACNAF